MRNARLDKAQSGIKIVGRNINNLRYADDTTLIKESEEELCILWKLILYQLFHLLLFYPILRVVCSLSEQEMATHSSVLAWRVLRMEEPGGLLSMGSHRVRHN